MNEIAFSIGGFQVYWYSLFIILGVVLAYIVIRLEAKRLMINKDFIFNLMFWAIIFGIIGARLYYVIFKFQSYKDNLLDIFKIWEGGLAIHGGIIAGLITMYFYCKKYKMRLLRMTDIVVPGLILAQGIGRWGNFFNQEAYGSRVALSTLKNMKIIPDFVIEGMKIGNIYYHPTFYYEFLWCILGFIILIIVRKLKYIKIGQLTAVYMMWYGVGRFFIEGFRTDSLMFGGFRVAQIVSVVLFVIGLILTMLLSRKGRFEDLYSDKDNIKVRF